MIYSNKTKDDILIKDELERFSGSNLNFKLYHTLTRHDDAKYGAWLGLRGRISEEMLKNCNFPEPSEETLICFCGPREFNKTCEQILTKLGYTNDMI
jgi:NAD(P)H-flavin reductase